MASRSTGTKEGSRRNLTGILAAAVIAALAVGGGMYLWTVRNGERLTDRNLRELARMGREVEGRLANLHNVLDNLAKATGSSDLEDRAALIPYLTLTRVPSSGFECPRTRLTASPGVDVMDLACEADSARAEGASRQASDTLRIRGTWSLAALRPALVSEYFQMTLLADSSGEVVLSAPEATGIRVHDLSSLLDSARADTLSASATARAVTQIRQATIAGRSYRVFVQPLRVVLTRNQGESDEPATWLLAGLVPEERFMQERLALGPAVVLGLGLFLAIAFLALPFVRAASMGPRERLRVHHLLFLVASLVLVSGGVGLILADLAYFEPQKAHTLDQVGAVADTLRARTREEVDSAQVELDDLTRALWSGVRAVDTAAAVDSLWLAAGTGPDSALADSLEPVLLKTGVPLAAVAHYPILTMAYWIDASGQQFAKWTPRANNTSLVSVADRDYFRVIHDGRGWTPDDTCLRSYYIESILTWTTGEKSAAISADVSKDLQVDGRGVPPGPHVGVVLTRFAALDRPVLPAGVSFAVVDSTGKALFHARKERALEENLIEETGENQLLRSTLIAHGERDLDAVYRGRRTRLYVRPLEGTPISVVVMLDMAQLETVHFETAFVSATLFVVFCVLMMLWLVLVEVVVPRKMHWVWPDPDHAGKYLALGVVLTLFVAAFCLPLVLPGVFGSRLAYLFMPFQGLGLGLVALSVAESHDDTMRRARWFGVILAVATTLAMGVGLVRPAWASGHDGTRWGALGIFVIVALASVLAFAVVRLEYLVDRRRSPFPRSRIVGRLVVVWRRLRTWLGHERRAVGLYLYAMVAGLVLIGVLPGFLLYQITYRDHLESMVRQHEVVVHEDLDARRILRDSIVRSGKLAGFERALDSTRFDLTGSLPFDVCWPDSTRIPVGACKGPQRESGGSPDHLPAVLRRMDRLVPYLSEASLAMRGLREPQPDRTWGTGSDGSPWLFAGQDTLRSTIPPGSGQVTIWWLLALAAGVGLLFWMVRWMSRRVFLVDLWASPPVQLSEILHDPSARGNLVVVCTRSTDRSALHPAPEEWDVIDLMDIPVDAAGRPNLVLDKGTSVLCIDHCDYRIRERQWGEALLDVLEPLVYVKAKARRIILLTSQEPSELLAPEDRDPADDDYAERWARMLGQFTRIAVRDGTRKDFKSALAEVLKRLTDPPTPGAAAKATKVLLRECRRPPLERIGEHILATLPRNGSARSELIARVRWEADTYYEALWTVLGRQEKLVMAQLASGAVVNPSLSSAVARLLGRGILVRGPELRVMNESFERFIRDRAPDPVIRGWEQAGSASTWQLIRLPFILGWIGLALLLFWTQRDLLGNTVTFLTTAGVGLGAIVRMLTAFRSGVTSPEPGKAT